MGMVYEKRSVDRDGFLRWIRRIQQVQFSDVTGPELDSCKVKTLGKFHEMRRFITWMSASYGSYGTRMFETRAEMSAEYGLASSSTIGRWIRAACLLGWLEQTVTPDSRRGLAAEYQVAPFWLEQGDVRSQCAEEPPF
jgi:hypothetical protein